jgi:hypothetical protein
VQAGATVHIRPFPLSAVCLALALLSAATARAQTNTYTVSGAGGGSWGVDDDLNVYLGTGTSGQLLYSTGTALSNTYPPFTFKAMQGDAITDQVIDTYGHCTSMTALYLSCNGSTPVEVDPGFNLGCGRPAGNNGQSYINTYTIPAISGCGGTPIASVEFTQAIQQYQSLADLKASLAANNEPPVPIVSYKPAVMRIYFTPVQSVTTYTVTVTGPVYGTKTYDALPNCSPQQQRARHGPCSSVDFYFQPPSGAWSAFITVDDSKGNPLESELLGITSRDTYGVNLTGVPGCATGAVTDCGDVTDLLSATELAKTLWPTSNVSTVVTWEKRVTVNAATVLDSDGLLKFTYDMLAKVSKLYSVSDALDDSDFGTRTAYVAVYPRSIGNGGGIGTLPGHGMVIPELSSTDIYPESSYVAHEFGHTINERHTNVALPPFIAPDTPPGCFGLAPVDPGQPTTWPFSTNYIQSGVATPNAPTYEVGFNPATQSVIDPMSNFDIMSYCIPDWIAPINYKLAFNLLGGGSVASPSLRQRIPEALEAAKPLAQPAPVLGAYWQVSGSIGTGGATLDPVFTQTIPGSTDPGSGTYEIEELSNAGQILYTRYFTPTTVEPDPFSTSTVFPTVDPIFSEWIPATAGTASITVLDPNGNVLATLPFTGAAPTVTITSPLAGFVGSGVQTISWTIQSAATSFTSRVFYSTDGGTTWQQIDELNATSDSIDFSKMPGAAAAMFRIDVSDGVNTGSATSVPFSVPKKAPSTIVINNPVSGAVQPAADPVRLRGAAYDADDGMLTGTALQWTDSVQGALGSGSPLTVNLNPGSHTITLTATDSDGNLITATTSITLGGGRPVVSLTTNTLSPNCVSATINAVPGNQGAALSTAQYSLDGGTTYTSVPLNALPFSFIVPGSTGGTLVAVAQDLSRQTAAQSTVINLTGACAAGTPSVSSGSPQLSPVGSAFATPLAALVSDMSGNPVAGVAVNFTAPATGASATLSSVTATTNSSGIASVTATANSSNGTYQVVASVPGFSTTAQFSLTNTDFTLGLVNPSLTVMHGSSGTETITITPLSGFNSAVTLGCTALPDGVTCTFSPASLTPSGAPLTSTLTITAANNATAPATAMRWGLPGGGLLLAFGLLGPGMRRRRKYLGTFTLLALGVALLSANGCGGSFHSFTSPVTVTATSGSLTHSSSVSVSVQ